MSVDSPAVPERPLIRPSRTHSFPVYSVFDTYPGDLDHDTLRMQHRAEEYLHI